MLSGTSIEARWQIEDVVIWWSEISNAIRLFAGDFDTLRQSRAEHVGSLGLALGCERAFYRTLAAISLRLRFQTTS